MASPTDADGTAECACYDLGRSARDHYYSHAMPPNTTGMGAHFCLLAKSC